MLGMNIRDKMGRGGVQNLSVPTLDRRQPLLPATLPISPPPHTYTHTPATIGPVLSGQGGLATRVNMAKTGL